MSISDFGDLGSLADPGMHGEPIALDDPTADDLVQLLRSMVQIRVVEEFIGEQVAAQRIACPCHLAIGQEAVPVGVARHLRATDRVFGTHRSHGHYLAQGGGVAPLLAEVQGRATGCSHGMGGSMHLLAREVGFLGSVPIVGATVPLAVGAGLAAQRDRTGDVAVAYFGDGAMEEGVVHESLNFASTFGLPVLFVVENNLFSSHLHIRERQPSNSVARFARSHLIPTRVVDGNDVLAVSAVAEELIGAARRGSGPGFIEAVTYRWRGHVGASEDLDVGVQRQADLSTWKLRDPIARFARALAAHNIIESGSVTEMEIELRAMCEAAWAQASAAPFPPASALLDMVYKQPTGSS